jgi:hypothetical protein
LVFFIHLLAEARHHTLVTQPERPKLRLAIDTATLRHLAVGERGLVRYRVDNAGADALDTITLATTLSDDPLEPITIAALAPALSTR